MKNKIIIILGILLFTSGVVGIYFYNKIFSNAVKKETSIFIKSNSTMNDLKTSLEGVINNYEDFLWVADLKKFNKPKGGMYVVKKGMNMNELVNLFRSGNQTAIKVTFNNQDTLEKFAGRIAQQIEADSISLLNVFREPKFLQENDFTDKSVLGMYIPNQYEIYWNTSPENFRKKMLNQYNKFWNKSRLDKASKLGLSEDQVITLASIVQKETAQVSERPMVAGLYLNRFKNKWPLEADPTVIYALKQINGQDFMVKRVLFRDIENTKNSPYNTYKKVGLPPAPISMPDISSIEAVLNPVEHDYYFMCASVDKIGFHEFAKTLGQHNRNAKKYQRWINNQGIKR
ncbi:aminodeoxychorismate lyase [Tenacibaculum sp. SZ-18]|uniref:endolytic transglycosylase MltG n=1 Tax=Tenacibaculum sp. SZ-18 TaxID=754423 RepID=UPI000C2D1146|nr:endolytic transglycosylase MltG [Tenacibaculum sp. SZ-18]AUC14721.1 aminodeoxychorismate lyase [Tenacibaculum sp. SZ-18]